MKRITVALVLVAACAGALAARQQTPLQRAAAMFGVANINSLQLTGSGAMFSVGQNYTPADPWPRVTVKSYAALVNYATASMRQDILREMGAVMPRGGGAPFFGEQRQILVVGGNRAWNVAPPAQPGAAPAPATPQPAATQVERMLWLWTTPHGFVKAAIANNATSRAVAGGTELSFTVGGTYKMTGVVDAQGHVVNVQTWIDNPVVGDMLVETNYSGYKDFGGVMFPARIVQAQDGFPSLDLTIATVTANAPAEISVPAEVSNPAPAAPVVVTPQRIAAQGTADGFAQGVFLLGGGSHHSLAIEMRDHLIVVDLPNGQARGEAVLAKAKELVPGKPVRYVVTNHHHWDHLSGIRAAFAENATVVSHESNRAFLERIARAPHALGPDRQTRLMNAAKIQPVGAKGQLTDGARVVELHLLTGFEHTGDMLVVYLPAEKILALADAYTPPAQPGTPIVVTAVPNAKALYDNIQRLKLDVQTIVPFHGARTVTVAEVARAAGVTP